MTLVSSEACDVRIVDADKVATAPLSSTAFVPPASPLSVPVVPAHELRLSYDPESTLAVYQEGVLPLDGRKVDALLALLERGEALPGITIDPQGQVVDGHHRWMAHAMAGKPLPVSQLRIEQEGVFVDVPVHNDQGNLIHRHPAAIDNFWRWFGQSQLVDGQGRPMVVRHGTDRSFDAFDLQHCKDAAEQAFFFTNALSLAADFGDYSQDCYLKASSPAAIPYADWEDPLLRAPMTQRDAGFDSFIIIDDIGDAEKAVPHVFGVFEPLQIKSIHNDGAFDPTSPSLLDKNKPILSLERHDVLPPDNAFINMGNGACEL